MAWKHLEDLLIAKVEGKGVHLGNEYASEGSGRAVAVRGGLQNEKRSCSRIVAVQHGNLEC